LHQLDEHRAAEGDGEPDPALHARPQQHGQRRRDGEEDDVEQELPPPRREHVRHAQPLAHRVDRVDDGVDQAADGQEDDGEHRGEVEEEHSLEDPSACAHGSSVPRPSNRAVR